MTAYYIVLYALWTGSVVLSLVTIVSAARFFWQEWRYVHDKN
jgi:hypothetical protein